MLGIQSAKTRNMNKYINSIMPDAKKQINLISPLPIIEGHTIKYAFITMKDYILTYKDAKCVFKKLDNSEKLSNDKIWKFLYNDSYNFNILTLDNYLLYLNYILVYQNSEFTKFDLNFDLLSDNSIDLILNFNKPIPVLNLEKFNNLTQHYDKNNCEEHLGKIKKSYEDYVKSYIPTHNGADLLTEEQYMKIQQFDIDNHNETCNNNYNKKIISYIKNATLFNHNIINKEDYILMNFNYEKYKKQKLDINTNLSKCMWNYNKINSEICKKFKDTNNILINPHKIKIHFIDI
jgi:hypothetical protein